ncbi:MAG: M14 family zinc carboxypeptidase [Nocardioidaceae bacterium]
MRRGVAAVLVALACVVALVGVVPAGSAASRRPAVVESRLIGHSVAGRAIYAWRVGDPDAPTTAVAMATMHGNEPAPRQILRSIRDGRPVHGVDLWVIPTVNPDGLARHTRKNADGIDLNRNFPWRWARLDGNYESGPRPASEPETRALMRFFDTIRPDFVVSFHQPLHGVDTSSRQSRQFAIRLATHLHLPRKRLVCGGVCHGTFTEWYMHKYAGRAVTVEYGDHPSRHRMRVTAPRQLLATLGAHR